jgi:hypothetical protein
VKIRSRKRPRLRASSLRLGRPRDEYSGISSAADRRIGARSGKIGHFFAAVSLAACAGAGGGAPAPGTQSHDVVVAGPQAAPSSQGYEYVAKRPLGVVALAEARGLDPQLARVAIDRLADALDQCVTEEGRKGAPVDGAARIVVQLDDAGNVAGTTLKVDPRPGAPQSAVVCLLAPLRMLGFGASDAGARGLAIEALWGSAVQGAQTASPP